MGQLHIGTGGWDYFRVPDSDRLKAYSSVYDFVEVNSTYYRVPRPASVTSWRRRVPSGFEFAVRCPRSLVERYRLEMNSATGRIIDSMEKICRYLKASTFTISVSKPVVEDKDLAQKLDSLISRISFEDVKVAVEFRGSEPSKDVLEILDDHGALHCVDISREDPKVESNVLYSRLFGKGPDNIYEFDDDELKEIATKAKAPKFEKSILAFHGVRMHRDAARLTTFLKSGRFPSLTGQVGLDSLGAVLREDATFPTTRANLLEKQGWKLFDKTSEERVRARQALEKLPNRSFRTLNEVLSTVSLESF